LLSLSPLISVSTSLFQLLLFKFKFLSTKAPVGLTIVNSWPLKWQAALCLKPYKAPLIPHKINSHNGTRNFIGKNPLLMMFSNCM
jgi:hypothetical protein